MAPDKIVFSCPSALFSHSELCQQHMRVLWLFELPQSKCIQLLCGSYANPTFQLAVLMRPYGER